MQVITSFCRNQSDSGILHWPQYDAASMITWKLFRFDLLNFGIRCIQMSIFSRSSEVLCAKSQSTLVTGLMANCLLRQATIFGDTATGFHKRTAARTDSDFTLCNLVLYRTCRISHQSRWAYLAAMNIAFLVADSSATSTQNSLPEYKISGFIVLRTRNRIPITGQTNNSHLPLAETMILETQFDSRTTSYFIDILLQTSCLTELNRQHMQIGPKRISTMIQGVAWQHHGVHILAVVLYRTTDIFWCSISVYLSQFNHLFFQRLTAGHFHIHSRKVYETWGGVDTTACRRRLTSSEGDHPIQNASVDVSDTNFC